MRQEEFVNHKMPTGSIEIYPKSLSILNQTKTLPFQMVEHSIPQFILSVCFF